MTDKEFTQTIYPSARCVIYENTSDSRYSPEETGNWYVIYADDNQNREYMLGGSLISEDDAWARIANTFRNKMLAKLEESRT